MRILIAPDKFKRSLDAREVAENIAKGLRDVLPNAKIDIIPMADGGEGTVEVISDALGGSWLQCRVHDPLGREIDACYAWIENRNLAVMEMSEAAGMWRLSESERDPLLAKTFGVGEMILNAVQCSARKIIIGLGGSATNDGGFGMARALGFRFFADTEAPVAANASPARTVWPANSKPQPTRLPPQLTIVAAVDVRSPLLGANGATRVFAPQKGASENTIEVLERSLTKLADAVSKEFGLDYRDEAGAGAAGGLGFGLMSFCNATIRPGFDVVAEAIGLESKMKDVDVVITGEGSLDRQTLEGKTPAGVARLARKLDKPVFAIVGRASKDREVRELFDNVYELAQRGMSQKEQMARAAEFLQEKARELAKTL